MVKIPKIFLCFVAILILACSAEIDPGNNGGGGGNVSIKYEGKVLCDQKGVAGVVVSDGTNCALTDQNGAYSLSYNPSATHIYISSPAGYSVSVENSVPKFWVRLNQISDKKNINFNLSKLAVSDNKHYFIAIGDPQVRNTTELNLLNPILDNIKKDISSLELNPVHLMVAGDIVFNKPSMHDQSKTYFSSVNQPVYYAIGNHDHVYSASEAPSLTRDKSADSVFIRHYGPTHFSFNRGQVHYIVLDNIYFKGGADADYQVEFTQEQLKWVEKDLSFVTKEKALVLMFHAPSKSRYSSVYGNSADLHVLLKGYANVQIISGHTHYNSVMADNSGITEHIVGAACGGFWEGPVCLDGALLGYKIFEVNGTNFKWNYRAYTDPASQFSVFKPEPRAPLLRPSGELLVNVWDWDPAWIVRYSEDGGNTFTDMIRIADKAFDPTAYQYFGADGENRIPTRTWINASLTDHIFKCIPSPGSTKVIIKAINRFDIEFRKEVEL